MPSIFIVEYTCRCYAGGGEKSILPSHSMSPKKILLNLVNVFPQNFDDNHLKVLVTGHIFSLQKNCGIKHSQLCNVEAVKESNSRPLDAE